MRSGRWHARLRCSKSAMVETNRLRAEQSDAEQRQTQQRKADMVKLADDFEGSVGEIIETISSSSSQLEASAGTLASTAERTKGLAGMVAEAHAQGLISV